MRILVLNESCSDNVGDQAISIAMKCSLEQRGYEVISRDFSCRKIATNDYSGDFYSSKIKRLIPSLLKRLIFVTRNFLFVVKESRGVEVAVIGGGQLILSNSNFPWAMALWVLVLKLRRVRVLVLSVGAGVSYGFVESFLYKRSLSAVDGVFLRDAESIVSVKRNFNIRAVYCPDIVYALPVFMGKRSSEKAQAMVCITAYDVYVRYAGEMEGGFLSRVEYSMFWCDKILDLVSSGNDVILASTTIEDLNFSEECFRLLASSDKVTFVSYVPSVDEFMSLLSNCDSVIAGRMHALIFGHLVGVRVNPYFISKKIEAFANEYLVADAAFFQGVINVTLDSIFVSE